jgi:hypothetical protein
MQMQPSQQPPAFFTQFSHVLMHVPFNKTGTPVVFCHELGFTLSGTPFFTVSDTIRKMIPIELIISVTLFVFMHVRRQVFLLCLLMRVVLASRKRLKKSMNPNSPAKTSSTIKEMRTTLCSAL